MSPLVISFRRTRDAALGHGSLVQFERGAERQRTGVFISHSFTEPRSWIGGVFSDTDASCDWPRNKAPDGVDPTATTIAPKNATRREGCS
jgi:hypothetical protein